MNHDLYHTVGGTIGDALAAIDALLRIVADIDDEEAARTLTLTCRMLLARVDQERKRTK
jgi:hypothetical protein